MNLMKELFTRRKISGAYSACCQMAKMSSVKCHQTRGEAADLVRNSCSRVDVKRFTYEGAIRVLMAVHWSCKWCFPLKENLLRVRINSIILIR